MKQISTQFPLQNTRQLSQTEVAVLKTLLYFDVFQHPLTRAELFHFIPQPLEGVDELDSVLKLLLESEMIEQYAEYYFLQGCRRHAETRFLREERAVPFRKKADQYGKIIGAFPFVRGVLVTGSLAKNCMDENGDIDYLVITAPDRLWVTRFLLVLYKKIFLFDSRKYFCTNYYLSTAEMTVPDKNTFTATEIITALPVYDEGTCRQFYDANNWVKQMMPNSGFRGNDQAHLPDNRFSKRMMERLLGRSFGRWADEVCMRLFVWRWKQKFGNQQGEQFSINFRSSKNVSKHHPQGFQFRVLNGFEKRIAEFEQQYNVSLS